MKKLPLIITLLMFVAFSSSSSAGSVDMKILATLFTGDNTEPASWKAWDYSGKLGLRQ